MSLGEPSRFAWLSTHPSSNTKTLLWTRGQQMQNDQGGVVNSTLVATMIREDVRFKNIYSDLKLSSFFYCKQIFRYHTGPLQRIPLKLRGFYGVVLTKMEARLDSGWKEIQPSKKWSEQMDVSENNGTPKSSILIWFSIINHPFLGYPYFWKHPDVEKC